MTNQIRSSNDETVADAANVVPSFELDSSFVIRHSSFTDGLIILGLLALTFALYARVAHFEFINYDDGDYVTQNRVVRQGLTPDGVAWAFTTGHAANWHPLTWLSHMLDVSLFGVDSPGAAGKHHLVNVALHAINSGLLFVFLLRATAARWTSAFVACVFATHPLHVESVAWIAERKDVLSGMFWMLTLIAYVEYARRKRWAWFLATLVLLALGLMSKPMLVTLPFVLLLLDYWPLRRLEPRIRQSQPGVAVPQADPDVAQPPPAVTPLLLEKLPLFLLVAVASAVTFVVQSQARAVVGTTRYPLALRLANAVVSYATYLRQTFVPHHLAIFYPHVGSLPGHALSPPLVIGSAALLLAFTVVAILVRRRAPWVIVGWLWFLGTLVPVIGLVQVGQQAHADRYMYLPMIGVLLMIAFTLRQLANRSPTARAVIAVACVFATLACAVVTWRQVATWRNSETVMRHAIDVVPDNYTAHDNLGEYLDSINEHEAARHEYETALTINRDDPIALYNLAVYAQSTGDATEAAHLYKRSLQLDPHYAAAWSNYGNLIADQGHAEEAIRAYREAIKLAPELPEPYHNLALSLAQQGKIDEAIPLWRRALQLRPNYPAARESLQKALEYQRTEKRKR